MSSNNVKKTRYYLLLEQKDLPTVDVCPDYRDCNTTLERKKKKKKRKKERGGVR